MTSATLDWAIDRSGKSISALQKHFAHLDDWRSGTKRPTLTQLRKFAQATFTPFGYLFLEVPHAERLPLPYFRTPAGLAPPSPTANLLDTVFAMQRRQAWAREYLGEQGQRAVPLVGSAQLGELPGDTARRLRTLLDLDDGWARAQATWADALRHLIAVLDTHGVMVVVNGVVGNNTRRPLSVSEFRGFAMSDDLAPLLFVNGADAKGAQLFTIAHEVAHLAFGKSAAFDLRNLLPADDPTEKACNDVAAEFLVPAGLLQSYWNEVRDQEDWVGLIARQFKVSRIVAMRRALDLSLIGRSQFFELYNEQSQRDRAPRQSTGGNFTAMQRYRVGALFGRLVATAAREGTIPYTEALGLTDLSGQTFDQFVQSLHHAGGRP